MQESTTAFLLCWMWKKRPMQGEQHFRFNHTFFPRQNFHNAGKRGIPYQMAKGFGSHFYLWQCALNIAESSAIVLVLAFGTTPGEDHVAIDSVHVDTVSSARLLGVIIDTNLMWDDHVAFIVGKVAFQ